MVIIKINGRTAVSTFKILPYTKLGGGGGEFSVTSVNCVK